MSSVFTVLHYAGAVTYSVDTVRVRLRLRLRVRGHLLGRALPRHS